MGKRKPEAFLKQVWSMKVENLYVPNDKNKK